MSISDGFKNGSAQPFAAGAVKKFLPILNIVESRRIFTRISFF
jgi:hypothetical protein